MNRQKYFRNLLTAIVVFLLSTTVLATADIISLSPDGQQNWIIPHEGFGGVSLLGRITTYYYDPVSLRDGTPQGWIVQYDSTGAKRWKFSLGNANDVEFLGVVSDENGNAVVVLDDVTGGNTNLADCVDSNGKEIWTQNLGDEIFQSIVENAVGDIYFYTLYALDSETKDLANYSPSGEFRWKRSFLGLGNSGINVEQDGSVIIAGEILDSGCNAVKLDRNGNEQWRTSLDERGVQFGGLTFLAEGNENALFFGFDDAQGANSYIIKLDAEGHLVWKNELFPEVAGISACQDGGVIACLSELLDDGRISHHTVKLDSSGKQVFDSSFEDDIELQITLLDSCAADRFGNTYRHAVNCEQVDVYENCIIWKSIVVKYDENGSEIWVADLHNLTPTSTPSPEAIYIENPYRGFTLSPGLRPTFDNSDDDVTRDDDIMPDDDTTPDDDSSHSSGGGNSGCGC